MQFSENWLKEFIDINISTEELCEQLTMLGLEVDGFEKYKSYTCTNNLPTFAR